MNILLVNHYAGSVVHGMEYRPFYLAREWVRLGHRVTVVAASFSHLRTRCPSATSMATCELIQDVQYVWLKTPHYQGNGLRRFVNMCAFVGQLFLHSAWLAQRSQPDVVIASSTYPLDIFPARWIARRARARLVFEVHDLWPLTPIEVGGMPRYHPFIVLLQFAEDYAYRNADRVVSMLPKAESYMREHGLAPSKFSYIPNGIDVAEWRESTGKLPAEHRHVLARLKRSHQFLVGYAGGHGVSNHLDTLVEAASLLASRPVTFVLVGQGPEKGRLERMARGRHLHNIVFLPPVQRSAIPAFLGAMDALYIGWAKQPLYRFGISPNKLLDYMMTARPVIHAVEAGNDPVAESQCGVSVPAEDPAAVADAVLRLMATAPEERAAMGARGAEYVASHHDYALLAARFLSVLTDQAPAANEPLSTASTSYD